MRRPMKPPSSKKEKASTSTSEANGVANPNPNPKVSEGGRKRKEAESAPMETEYFPEKRNLEDLWQAAFPVGTEWDNMDKLKEINWNFSNLEEAFEEGGELYGKKVYMFGCTEPQLLEVNGEQKVTLIPVVVVVVSPVPPSDKIGVKSVQRVTEDIIPMKAMKMAWVPYIPLENRLSQVEKFKTQIYTMACTQRRSALKQLKIDRVKQYDYCLPYLQPLKADEEEVDTVVNIMYPIEPPIVCDYDWDMDDLEDFTNDRIMEETLPVDQKDAFKEYVRELVRERKGAQRQAKEARRRALEDMDPETKAALENMKVYKFYPKQTPDTPDISKVKVEYINRYYRKSNFLR